MSKVSIDWESDPKKVLDAMKAIEAETIKLKGRIEEVARGGEQAHKEHLSAIGQGAEKIKDFAKEYVGLKAAIEIVNSSREREIELGERALELQKRIAGSKVQLQNALPAMSPQQQLEVDARVKQLREVTLHRGAGNILAGAVSQGFGLTLEQNYQAARVAGLMQPGEENEQAAVGLAGDIAHIQRLTGAGSAEEAYGKLSAMSFATGFPTADVANRLVPTAESMKQHGESFEQAAAALVAFEWAAGKKKGASAYEALAAALDDEDKFKPTAKISGGTIARLEALRNNPKLLRQFLMSDAGKSLKGSPAREVLNEYVSGDLRAKIQAAALPSPEQARADTKARIDALHGTVEQGTSDVLAEEGLSGDDLLRDPDVIRQARAREAWNKMMGLGGIPGLSKTYHEKMESGDWLFGSTSEESLDRYGQRMADNLRNQMINEPSARDLQTADQIEKIMAEYNEGNKRIEKLLERQNEILEQQGDRDSRRSRGREGPIIKRVPAAGPWNTGFAS